MYTVHLTGIDVEFATSENAKKKDMDAFDALFRWYFNPTAEGWEVTKWMRHCLTKKHGYKDSDILAIWRVNNGNTSRREERPKKRRY